MPKLPRIEIEHFKAAKNQIHISDEDGEFYHNERWQHERKNRQFISCDTETYTPAGEEKQKVMLFGFGTATKEHYIKGADIQSLEMLNMIREVSLKYRGAIFFGFGFDFDVNFIMKDLPDVLVLKVLKHKIPSWYRGFRFEYLPKKFFRISGGKKNDPNRWSMTIYEVQNWFNNASLLNAYKDQIGEDKDYLFVEHGKGLRDVFTYEELETLVIPYWTVEQHMYVRLMERMRQLILDADLPLPKAWYGPSAVIARVYELQGLKKHLREGRKEILDDAYIRACQRGYYGGRFEQFKAGFHNGPVFQYDIVSAYPAAMLDLWSWKDARLHWIDGSEIDRTRPMPASYKFSLWDIEYTAGVRDVFLRPHPFPHRMKNGMVLFPHITKTSIWSPEMELQWKNPHVTILGGWVIEPKTAELPFEFYNDLFDRRASLKKSGNPAQYALKIAINSGYGKVAQRAGARIGKDGNWQIPSFHQLDWAGYITSHCRANIWRAITLVGWENVISVETDGIFTTKPIRRDRIPPMHCTKPFVIGNRLGQWEATEWRGMISIQSGIYWLRDEDGEWRKAKTRGLRRAGAKGTSAEQARHYLRRYDSSRKIPRADKRIDLHTLESATSQFNGTGTVGTDKWLTWSRKPKQIQFGGRGKRQHIFDKANPADRLVKLDNASVLMTEMVQSQPHPLPWSTYGDMENKRMFDEKESQRITVEE